MKKSKDATGGVGHSIEVGSTKQLYAVTQHAAWETSNTRRSGL